MTDRTYDDALNDPASGTPERRKSTTEHSTDYTGHARLTAAYPDDPASMRLPPRARYAHRANLGTPSDASSVHRDGDEEGEGTSQRGVHDMVKHLQTASSTYEQRKNGDA